MAIPQYQKVIISDYLFSLVQMCKDRKKPPGHQRQRDYQVMSDLSGFANRIYTRSIPTYITVQRLILCLCEIYQRSLYDLAAIQTSASLLFPCRTLEEHAYLDDLMIKYYGHYPIL